MIKILQWNILFKHSLNRLDEIIDEIKRFDCDIVCLQEVCHYNNDSQHIKKLLDLYTYHAYIKVGEFEDDTIYNVILSRYSIKNFKCFFIQQPLIIKPNDYANEPRGYIEAKIKIHSKILTVGTLHSSYTHMFTENENKDKEVENILSIIKNYKCRYIVTGDFNATPDSKYIKDVLKYLKNLSPDFSRKTWTTKPFSYNGFKETKLNWRLDYVFGTNDIKVLYNDILDTGMSDHLPVLAAIDF